MNKISNHLIEQSYHSFFSKSKKKIFPTFPAYKLKLIRPSNCNIVYAIINDEWKSCGHAYWIGINEESKFESTKIFYQFAHQQTWQGCGFCPHNLTNLVSDFIFIFFIYPIANVYFIWHNFVMDISYNRESSNKKKII